jgi:diaminopimelate decarboxylase
MAAGVKVMVDLANEIDEAVGSRRITVLDLGGGLTANYGSDEFRPSYADFVGILREVSVRVSFLSPSACLAVLAPGISA